MSRRTTAKKRFINPDPIYRSRLVSMMISRLLQDGKKSVAARLFYQSLETIGTNLSSQDAKGTKLGASTNQSAKTSTRSTELRDSKLQRPSEARTQSSTSSESTENAVLNRLSVPSVGSSDALKVFQQAILNVTPVVEVKSRRVGGSNYQVPLEVNSERGTALALRWIVQAARQRPGREMAMKLANEFMDASNKTGNAIRKREETHRMAEANKAFANYRF